MAEKVIHSAEVMSGALDNAAFLDPAAQAVETISILHERAERRVDRHQRAIESITGWLGRPGTLYVVILIVVLWVGANILFQSEGRNPIDPPPFQGLQAAISFSALLTTIVILTTQNRLAKLQERRSQLDLQIGLLAEQKTTKLISLLEELRRDLPSVRNRHDAEAEVMQQPVDPHAMLVALEATLEDTLDDVKSLEVRLDSQEAHDAGFPES